MAQMQHKIIWLLQQTLENETSIQRWMSAELCCEMYVFVVEAGKILICSVQIKLIKKLSLEIISLTSPFNWDELVTLLWHERKFVIEIVVFNHNSAQLHK